MSAPLLTPLLSASGISVRRNGRLTLEPSDLTLHAGETVAIYGPNGAGKSTLVQALAGLLPLASGTIVVQGKTLGRELTPLEYHRRIAAVFQEPLLLRGTVAHNVELGLRLRGVGSAERDARVRALLQQLKIGALADRPVGMLSGGEAQRTSLARALVLEPELLFLDEPFAALDQPTRLRLTQEFAALLSTRRMTTVFVTHDLAEASAISDHCIIVDAGRIAQRGRIADLLEQPQTRRVAEIIGFENIWEVTVSAVGAAGVVTVDWHGRALTASAAETVEPGSRALVAARAENLYVPADGEANRVQRLSGRVQRLHRLLHGAVASVALGGDDTLAVYCPQAQAPVVGDRVDVALPVRSLRLMRA